MSGQLAWLMGLQRFGMKPGLERMEQLLGRLDHPGRDLKVILVGGTNGKGSTAALLAAVLSGAGLRTGLFTSPHLTDVMERFVVDGRQLPTASLEEAVDTLRPVAEELGATFFEVMVACAWLLFRAAGCTHAVMEVGLGGRFDATNASEPVLSVISNVELDHTAVLGGTRELIAADKARLMRPGMTTVTAAAGGPLRVLREHAARTGARLLALSDEFSVSVLQSGWEGSRLAVHAADWSLEVDTPLPGSFQALNTAVATVAAHELGVSDAHIVSGLRLAGWPGRLERLQARGRTWLLDGAHNPAGAVALRSALEELGARPALLVLGLTDDKDSSGIVGALAGLAPQVLATRSLLSPRAVPPEQLLPQLPPLSQAARSPEEALDLAVSRTQPGELIVVAGSLYLLGEVRPLLSGQTPGGFERWQ